MIDLNGNRFDENERKTLYELSKERDGNAPDAMLARINGKLSELYKKVNPEDSIEFIPFTEIAGYEAYRRSCSMLFMKAVRDVVGAEKDVKTILHFSICDGFFYTIEGIPAPDAAFYAKVEEKMRELVARDILFRKKAVPTAEARRIFREEKMQDKDRLFRYRISSRTNLYELDGFRDYNYGFLVYSTGVLKHFELIPYQDGVVLMMPDRKNPDEVKAFAPYEKFFAAQVEAERWAGTVNLENISALDDRIVLGDMGNPILISEAYHEAKIAACAAKIASRKEVRFVMIAGPSSSGKTTFSQRLSIQLSAHGLVPFYVGVDNYFVNREETPLDEFGKKDYECLEAIDVAQFNRDMLDLLGGKTIRVPTYNFQNGSREYNGESMTLPENGILVIEGIHALNDAMAQSLPKEAKFKIYISALTQLNIDDHDRIPTRDGRLLRRMVRDNRTRGYTAKDTLSMWESVMRGEEKHIFPYQESADIVFNSALPYELAVLKQYAQPLLFQIDPQERAYEEARRLLKFLDYVIGLPDKDVPANSILREFIGGGCFHL